MTITTFDFARRLGLAPVFAGTGYSRCRANEFKTALPKAAADGAKGATSLAVITPGYQSFTH